MKHLINTLLRVARVKLVDDTGPIQRLQIDEGDLGAAGGRRIIDNVAHVMQFGFTSAPPLEAELLLGAPGGDRTQTIAFGSNHQPSRPRNLTPGDSCQYDVRGQIIRLTHGGLLIDCAGLPAVLQNCPTIILKAETTVTIDAPAAHFTGAITTDGAITAAGEIQTGTAKLAVLHQAYLDHKHPVSGSETGTPDVIV